MENAIKKFMTGKKLCEQRARKVLPILVQCAHSQKKMYYSELAEKVDMLNARNLNYVLGCVGRALEELGQKWNTEIPPIQCIIVNKASGLPGEGVGWFIDKNKFDKFSKQKKEEVLRKIFKEIYSFQRWPEILREFGIKPISGRPTDSDDEQEDIDRELREENTKKVKKRLRAIMKSSDVIIKVNGKIRKRDDYMIGLIKRIRGYKCQICGFTFRKKDGGFYAEGAHIIEKRSGRGKETPDNIVILCPNHHKEFDLGEKTIISQNKTSIKFKLNNKNYSVGLGI